MSTSWRVVLSSKLWDQKKFEEEFALDPENRRIAQSKGTRHMVSCPQKGDNVSFVLKGNVVMRGVVESDGFENGTAHQNDSCNKGNVRPHATIPQFVWIRIKEIGLSECIRHTGQNTWAKMPL